MAHSVSRRGLMAGLAATGALAAGTGAGAQVAPVAPAEPTLLTVRGRISRPNAPDGTAVFTRGALERLGLVSLTTGAPWYDRPGTFEGVGMARLLEAVGAIGTRLKVQALNDYVINVPIADFTEFNVILAMKRDGATLGPRDKGPLFIVYPYDADRRLQSDVYYGRSVWQVASFTVE